MHKNGDRAMLNGHRVTVCRSERKYGQDGYVVMGGGFSGVWVPAGDLKPLPKQ